MRWPFGPPHLTLKPSRKTKKNKTKKKQNTKIPKKTFQLSINFFCFGGWPKFPLFDNLAKKRAPKKHYENRGFSKAFFENRYASRSGHFWIKKTQIPKFQLSFLVVFFSFSTKNTTINWNPDFYSVLANLKKENFQNLKLKHRKLKTQFLHPLFEKNYFLKIAR